MAKVRVIVCKQLASLLRFVDKPMATYDDIASRDQAEDNILDEGFTNHVDPPPAARPGAALQSDPVLIDIRELLRQKTEREDEERIRSRDESDLKSAWTLAARVVNRICFLFFSVVYFTVTAGFFFVFHLHH